MQKRNGTEDILKKTLVIIDEAHKLYSPDIKASEKPNIEIMNKLIKKSYSNSGKDSVKLLLLTATPYTNDPMHLIKLINLMKESNELPEDFNEFTKKYLDKSTSKFTDIGAEKYLNDINGYISYLNRDRDIRNFAYPVFYNIEANMSKSGKNIDDIRESIKSLEKDIFKDEEYIVYIKKGKDIKNLPISEKKLLNSDVIKHTKRIKDNKAELKKSKKILKDSIENDISQESVLQKCLIMK